MGDSVADEAWVAVGHLLILNASRGSLKTPLALGCCAQERLVKKEMIGAYPLELAGLKPAFLAGIYGA